VDQQGSSSGSQTQRSQMQFSPGELTEPCWWRSGASATVDDSESVSQESAVAMDFLRNLLSANLKPGLRESDFPPGSRSYSAG
jgi:hypothetical protein